MNAELVELARRTKSDLESLDCKFVEPFPEEVQSDCSICLHILKEPYVVSCCGYRFCKACLPPSIRSCPLCKATKFDKIPDRQLERLLNQRAVYCLLRCYGCNWTGELKKLSSHLDFGTSSTKAACRYLPVPCIFCNDYFKRAYLQFHQENCMSRPTICSYCHRRCSYKDLSQHVKICPKRPQQCKHKCSDKHFYQEEMEAHLANDCPLEMVSCEYRFAGCGTRCFRKDIEEHMEGKLKVHLHLVTAKCKQLQDKENGTSSALQMLRKENERLSNELAKMSLLTQHLFEENETLKQNNRKREILNLTVTNLPVGVTKHNLKCVFGQHGTVESIILNKPHNAIITYSEQSEYEAALDADSARGINLLKRRLSLEAKYSF